jgi:hypothetical protein
MPYAYLLCRVTTSVTVGSVKYSSVFTPTMLGSSLDRYRMVLEGKHCFTEQAHDGNADAITQLGFELLLVMVE